ncbi:MAG: S4 domain-containing protein [Candidatus Thorarchaeota archaeon]|jgi:23S rRNA (cytidine1920-2'-O)/16S rRNA (cytidine1409-2'-O)-methyltransferase
MSRLDVWLVETGQFSSRQAAKRAIKDGLVIVNGRECKPSKQVSEKDTIELLSTEVDVPQGFQKLKELDERLQDKLVCGACTALDIGSSAGGFLIYLAEKGANVTGIEVSKRFSEELQVIVEKYPQISVVFTDAFDMDPSIVANNGQLDLLLVDVTTEPEGTLKLIEKFTPLLKKEGRMLAAFKSNHKSETLASFKEDISQLGYEQIQELILDETLQEVHITAIHT